MFIDGYDRWFSNDIDNYILFIVIVLCFIIFRWAIMNNYI